MEKTAAHGAPKTFDNSALTETICQIAISGSTANGRRLSEEIRIHSEIFMVLHSGCSLRGFNWADSLFT